MHRSIGNYIYMDSAQVYGSCIRYRRIYLVKYIPGTTSVRKGTKIEKYFHIPVSIVTINYLSTCLFSFQELTVGAPRES